jgi:hypothetical protein
MRKILTLAAVVALAGCGGGGGGSNAPAPTTPGGPTQTQGKLVTPQFYIVVPPKSTAAKARATKGARKPDYVSSAAASVTITLVSVNGSTSNLPTPSSVSSNISGTNCTVANPCPVPGPPSPPGVPDVYTITTFDGAVANSVATGNALDSGGVTFTPTVGTNTVKVVTLDGIPSIVVITTPGTLTAGTASQTETLSVTVQDHSTESITGPFANSVTITNSDTIGTQGVTLSDTESGCNNTGTSCTITDNTDTITLNYGGLAENPVTFSSSGTNLSSAGTATFTPTLNAIVGAGGNPISAAGGTGIDLYTTSSGSPVGYTGTVAYSEHGFTDSPYNKVLSATAGTCSLGGPLSTYASATTPSNLSGATDFTYSATVSSPVPGVCPFTVTDGLTDQTNTLPTFVVTYTTTQFGAQSKHRRN